ncbi:MAG: polymorphic toxin type 37 domain-containing protein [Bacteroidales bacterium]
MNGGGWSSSGFWSAVGMGAISGAITFGIGDAFGHALGSTSHEIGRAVVHGFAQGMMSEISGGDFMQGFLSGSLASLGGHGLEKVMGRALSTAEAVGFSALSGGIGAELSGGDFLKGATTGAIIGLLNQAGGRAGKKAANGDSSKPSLEDMKDSPPDHPDYKAPKSGARKVRNPNGSGSGWIDRKGRVWVPEDHDGTHGPHWDRQNPKGGGYERVYPNAQPDVDMTLRNRIGMMVGLSGTALTVYIIISEGSRLFPPRNLIPIP